jgi:hypothetical protein
VRYLMIAGLLLAACGLRAEYSYEATVLHLADRKPAANMKIRVTAPPPHPRGANPPVISEATTDADGKLKLGHDQLGEAISLLSLDPSLAFAASSSAWKGIHLQDGDNEGNILIVVPGGGMRCLSVDADSGKLMNVDAQLVSLAPGAGFQIAMRSVDGAVSTSGVPAGNYRLQFNRTYPTHWEAEVAELLVKAGEITEPPSVQIEPVRAIDVVALGEGEPGLEQYSVVAEQLSGYTPRNVRPESNSSRPVVWRVSVHCTAERNRVGGLARGVWRVTASADGWSSASTEVSVPETEPVTLKLKQGGRIAIKVKARGRDADFGGRAYLVATNSLAYDAVRRLPADAAVKELASGSYGNEVKAFGGDGSGWPHDPNRDLVNPGTYLLFASLYTYYRVDDVVVTRGATTDVILKPTPARVAILLKDKDRAIARALVYLVPHRDLGEVISATVNARTDNGGAAIFENLTAASYTVMTEREYRWVTETGSTSRRHLPYAQRRGITVGHGDRSEIAMQQFDTHFVWLTVKLKPPKDVSLADSALHNMEAGYGGIPVQAVATKDNVFEFGPVALATYEFTTRPQINSKHGGTLLRIIEAREPGEQTVEVELELGTLSVTVAAPTGVPMSRLRVYLEHDGPKPWRIFSGTALGGKPNERGKVHFTMVPQGPYRVTAWVENERDPRFAGMCCSDRVEVEDTTALSLKFNEQAGTLRVDLDDTPHTSNFLEATFIRVQLLDSAGKQALLGTPWSEYQRTHRNLELLSVATGTYTLRLSGEGFETYSQENVVIETGKVTALNVKLSLLHSAALQLENCSAEEVESAAPVFELVDVNGELVVPATDSVAALKIEQHPDLVVVTIPNIPARCAKIRFKAKGFNPIEFNVRPGQSNSMRHRAKLQRE